MGWVEMIAWPGRPAAPAASTAAQRFQHEIDVPICPSLSFSWVIGAKGKHASFADAQEHGCELSSVNA
jgi:hypothetical protein